MGLRNMECASTKVFMDTESMLGEIGQTHQRVFHAESTIKALESAKHQRLPKESQGVWMRTNKLIALYG